MKASELIELLQREVARWGDLEVQCEVRHSKKEYYPIDVRFEKEKKNFYGYHTSKIILKLV